MLQKLLSPLYQGLVELVFPPNCLSCDGYLGRFSRLHLCAECLESLELFNERCCRRCARPIAPTLDDSRGCPQCRTQELYFDAVSAVGPYQGVLRTLILRLKYQRLRLCSLPLAFLMFARFKALGWYWVDVIVPVPLHWWREYRRGFNQSDLVARHLSRLISRPILPVLRRIRATPSQTSLPLEKRKENVRRAFALRHSYSLRWLFIEKDIQGKNCLLVDDVLTTGFTASECARVLKRAGAGTVAVLTSAR